jgi:hypothetical protein
MEKIFWLMWLADIVGSIGVVGAICAIGFVLAFGFISFISSIDNDKEMFKRGWARMKWLLIPVIVATLLPSSKTIHVLVAASAVEVAASTTIGTKSLKAIETVLDGIIANSSKKE